MRQQIAGLNFIDNLHIWAAPANRNAHFGRIPSWLKVIKL